MENLKIKNNTVGRPRLSIDPIILERELEKYINGTQKAIETYGNLHIGKTSFFMMLKRMGIKR